MIRQRKAVHSTIQAIEDGDGRGGVFWHTQGERVIIVMGAVYVINKQSKNSIRENIENIYKAVGADGLIEFYGYLSEDTTTDSVQSIVENADDIEKDPGERFEEIETASEIVTIDSVGQDDSNDINSPDLNFFDQVKLAFKANDDD